VAVGFLVLPMRLLQRAGRDPRAYGLTSRPPGRNLVWGPGAVAVVFSLFLLGVRVYYTVLCATPRPAPCAGWGPSLVRTAGVHVAPNFALTAAAQLIVIAIPEEFFFRGYIQGRLREVFAPLPAIALSSLIFGLGHYLVDYDPQRLAVAFPAVLFGILRERTGSIAPGALFHPSCN